MKIQHEPKNFIPAFPKDLSLLLLLNVPSSLLRLVSLCFQIVFLKEEHIHGFLLISLSLNFYLSQNWMVPSLSHIQGKCSLKTFSSLCPFPFLFCLPPLSQDHPAAVLWDIQTVLLLLNRLSKLRTPQAWKKLYTHDNVFYRSKQKTSGQYRHDVVLANIICILTNNWLPKTLGDQ